MRTDQFDQELNVGDYVLAADRHDLGVYMITNMTPKMIRLVHIAAKSRAEQKGILRYEKQLYKIDPELATFCILKTD